jgi:xylulokinase
VASLSVIGGGARSRYWGTILAASLQTPLVYLEGGEVGPALGAARLAEGALTGAAAAAVCVRPSVAFVIEPDPDLSEQLEPNKIRFSGAYARLRDL